MVNYIDKKIEEFDGKYSVEAYDLLTKLTTDNVTVCSMGINGGSFDDSNGDIYKANKSVFEPNFKNASEFTLKPMIPFLTAITPER